MSEFMESTGKNVDEAIREALLRMGLRRDEVDVTVIQRDRGGLLGIGRRDAVVRVERKAGGKRSSSSGDSGRGGRRRGGGGGDARGERLDDGQDRGSRRGRRSSGGRGRQDGEQGGQESRGRDQGGRGRGRDGGGDGDSERGGRGSRGGRGRGRGRGRGGRDNEPVTAEGREETQPQTQSAPQNRDDNRSRRPDDEGGEGGRTRRRRRSRRRRKPAAEVESAVTNPTGDGKVFGDDAQETRQDDRKDDRNDDRNDERQETRTAEEQPRRERPRRQESPQPEPEAAVEAAPDTQPDAAPETPARSEAPAPAARVEGGNAIAEGLSALSRVAPYASDDTDPIEGFLETVATGLMVKSGFPCRVQVKDGEYHQVKMVVDDRSAGVLIGRHGNTVDAVEYLVEKMASHAVGDRVRMNLDINNYRLRRHDSIEERARNAAAEARNTGEPVKMPPMNGRERRLVHLEIEDMDELVTYTEDGYDGKCVVICRPDQVPEDQAPSTGPSDQQAPPAVVTADEPAEPFEPQAMAASENGPVTDSPAADDGPRTETAAVITDDADDLDDDEPRRDVD